jgi:sec-independent protein translocase protein TatA
MELLSFYMPGPWEIIIIVVVALLLFGRRLPEVGRSLGRGIVEFKKGLRGVEDEINQAAQDDKSDKSDKTPPSQG